MWRQGDILIERVESIPAKAKRLKHRVIERSQTTGHEHKVSEKRACRLYSLMNDNYLDVFAEKASLVHPEHDTIELTEGLYRIWRQREFTSLGVRTVVD